MRERPVAPELSSNATRFRFCPAIKRPQNVLRLTVTLGLSSVLSEFQANGWLGSWKGLAVGRGSSFGAVLYRILLSARASYRSFPWLYPIQLWPCPGTNPNQEVASARSHHQGSQQVAFRLVVQNFPPPNSQPGARLIFGWSASELLPVQSTRRFRRKRLSLGQARRRPLYSHPTPSSPCGFPGTVYFIRYIPTAPYRVGATVRAAD